MFRQRVGQEKKREEKPFVSLKFALQEAVHPLKYILAFRLLAQIHNIPKKMSRTSNI